MTAIEYALYGKQHGMAKLKADKYDPVYMPGNWDEWIKFSNTLYRCCGQRGSNAAYCDANPGVWDEVIYKLQQQSL